MTVRILIVCGGSGVNLLGQRNALGVHAELQIDVSRAIGARAKQARDYYSQFVELDRNVGTTGLLFQEARNWIPQHGSQESRDSVYIQKEICSQPDLHRLQFLLDYLPATVSLERGLAQLPAVGGLAIRHPQNRVALEQALESITTQLGIGSENAVEAWVISSTAGGVGEGVHRFTGAFLADFIRRRYTSTPIVLNFIRIGTLTYRSVNPRQTALNTFFGVAADAAFALRIPQDFPEATTHWFYIDFPDVGIGERSAPLRAQMIDAAVKVIMWEGLRKDLQKLLTHNQGIPFVIARVGYWGKEFSEQRRYAEALRQLRERLQELVAPDYARKYVSENVLKLQLVAARLTEWVERAGDEQHILQQIESGWRFPHYRMQGYPQSLDEVQALVEEWKRAVEALVGKKWEELEAEWIVEQISGRESLRVAEPGEAPFGSETWFSQVEEAHIARARAWHLLGCDLRTGQPGKRNKENRLERLLATAQRVSAILNGFRPFKKREKRAQEVREPLVQFIQTLAEVDTLLRIEKRAQHFLEKELVPVRQVLEVTDAEFRNLWSQWARPDYTEYTAQESPSFSVSDTMNERLSLVQNEGNLQTRLQQGWRLPTYRGFPRSLADVRTRVTAWKKALEALLGLEWIPGGEFTVKRIITVEERAQEEIQPLEQLLNEQENDWKRIENAHFVRAWVWHLLGCDMREGQPVQQTGTILEKLHHQTQRLIFLQMLARIPVSWWFKKVTRWMSPVLGEFLATLAQTDCLLRAEEVATKVLEQELQGDPLVIVRELSDRLDRFGRITWLQALYEGVRQANLVSFKKAVVQGLSGLSMRGLRQVLGLSNQASIENVHRKLLSSMGQMRTNGKVIEAPWWAGTPLQTTMSFEYRLLPTLNPNLQEQLRNTAGEKHPHFEYLFGFPELMVIAFSAASMAQELGDVLTAPNVLLQPFAPLVKNLLSEWDYLSAGNVPVRQLEVACAGVCGEPLYELALRSAGLDDEDLKRIGQYYTLYRRTSVREAEQVGAP